MTCSFDPLPHVRRLALGSFCSVSLAPWSTALAAAPANEAAPATEPATATEPASDPAPASASDPAPTTRKAKRYLERKDARTRPWIRRWSPRKNTFELGFYGGAMFLADDHDLYDPASAPQQSLWKSAPEFGVRIGYFPLRFVGLEGEFGAVPTHVRNLTDDFAFVYTLRGHVLMRLPKWRISPFVLFGAGALAINSHPILAGKDADPAVHWGAGAQLFVTKRFLVRADFRHILSAKAATQSDVTSHFEALGGFSWALGKDPPPPPPPNPDRDGDGFLNERDGCPDVRGVAPDGCPVRDSDGDGFMDPDDECPQEPGVAPDGCPIPDTDGDGFLDPDDKCPHEPETVNRYEDDDGCPDVMPEPLRRFDGVIEGIVFDFGKATIRPESAPILDKAIETLTEFDSVRLSIIGHTDNVGGEESNLELSRKRAEAVKQYLVDGGVSPDRLETRGAGQSEPRDTNETDEGRARNRRTEFKVLAGKGSVAADQKYRDDAKEPPPATPPAPDGRPPAPDGRPPAPDGRPDPK